MLSINNEKYQFKNSFMSDQFVHAEHRWRSGLVESFEAYSLNFCFKYFTLNKFKKKKKINKISKCYRCLNRQIDLFIYLF